VLGLAPPSQVCCRRSPVLHTAVGFEVPGPFHRSEGHIKPGGDLLTTLTSPFGSGLSKVFPQASSSEASSPAPLSAGTLPPPFVTDLLSLETGFADFPDLHIGPPGRS